MCCRSPSRCTSGSPPTTPRIRTPSFPPITPLRPPAGAPNVLVILIDDCGFGASSAFGGPCATPNAERLAAGGLKFNRFHTTALCAPTAPGAAHRAQPPHAWAWARSPRSRPRRPATRRCDPTRAAPLAEILKLNGYSTAQFGKCHEVPVWETSPMGPFRQWPTGIGLRVLLRLHRRRDQPVLPGDLRRHHAARAAEDAGGGLPLHRGHDRQGDRLGAPAEVAHARQAVLHVLRARRDPRAAPRARSSGRPSTRAASTPAGTRCARRPSPARRSSA